MYNMITIVNTAIRYTVRLLREKILRVLNARKNILFSFSSFLYLHEMTGVN